MRNAARNGFLVRYENYRDPEETWSAAIRGLLEYQHCEDALYTPLLGSAVQVYGGRRQAVKKSPDASLPATQKSYRKENSRADMSGT